MLQKLVFTTLVLVVGVTTSAEAQVLAVVGKKKITVQEFNKKYSKIKKQTINPPAPRVFLEDLVRFEVGVQEARKKKMDKHPLVKDKFNQALYQHLIETSIGDSVQKIKVNESEMRKFYKRNPEYRSSHILIEFKPGATPEQVASAEKRAKEIYAEVKKSKRPFADLVKLYSDDTFSKQNAGDIGYQSRVTLVPTYYGALLKMKMGQVKGLIRTRYGFHIIKLTGKRTYSQANKRQIRAAVFDKKRANIFNNYFVKLKKKYKISVKSNELKKIK